MELNQLLQKLPRFSASKLKMYEECPKSYMARYMIDERDTGINVWGIIGSAAHKAIELEYRDGTPRLATFQNRVAQSITEDVEGFENVLSVQASIFKGLAQFDPTLYTPKVIDDKLQLEKYFRLPYPNADNPVCTLEGYMDMITDTGYVVDYKTGKDVVSVKKVENDLQFIIYAWAHEQLYGTIPVGVIYHRLRDNKQVIGKKFDRTKLDITLQQIMDDAMDYEMKPCDTCPMYCGVRKVQKRLIACS